MVELKRIGIQKRKFRPRIQGSSKANTEESQKDNQSEAANKLDKNKVSPNESLNLSKKDEKYSSPSEILRESKSQPNLPATEGRFAQKVPPN